MELDDLKDVWAAHGALLERSLAIDEHRLREQILRRVRRSLTPYVLWRAVEVVAGVLALGVVVPVLGAHLAEPRYALAAGALTFYTIALTGLSVYLLAMGLDLDYGGPVAAIQRAVERMRMAEYRAVVFAVLGGVVIWLPAPLVLFEALTGVPILARVHGPWLLANLAFGAVVLGIGLWLSRRYVERPDLTPWARRLVDALSGRALRMARRELAELKRFVREEPPAE